MDLNLSQIEFSHKDLNREVKLPDCLTEELSEFIGVMVGDGHLRFSIGKQRNGTRLARSDIVISGNIREKEYLDYVRKLFYSIFNTTLSYEKDTKPGAVVLRAYSKGIVQFLNQVCEIPLNKKVDVVKIPSLIKKAPFDCQCAFLRGLADTDFSLTFKNKGKFHSYPVIKGTFKSKELVRGLNELIRKLGFIPCLLYNEYSYDRRFQKYYIQNSIYLNGKKNLNLWLKNINFSNPKFLRKIEKWKKGGFCPPNY
ncbi:hypothetical protein JXB28_02010 [Candidatus Woesearchaeota archaeon]|nr:hypothetical protein [Candidatus Woesearchaeota archaeon]